MRTHFTRGHYRVLTKAFSAYGYIQGKGTNRGRHDGGEEKEAEEAQAQEQVWLDRRRALRGAVAREVRSCAANAASTGSRGHVEVFLKIRSTSHGSASPVQGDPSRSGTGPSRDGADRLSAKLTAQRAHHPAYFKIRGIFPRRQGPGL